MRLSTTTTNFLRAGVAITLAFIYIPLIVIAIYAFNGGNSLAWPPPDLTTKWFGEAIDNSGARDAFVTSIKVGAVATAFFSQACRSGSRAPGSRDNDAVRGASAGPRAAAESFVCSAAAS